MTQNPVSIDLPSQIVTQRAPVEEDDEISPLVALLGTKPLASNARVGLSRTRRNEFPPPSALPQEVVEVFADVIRKREPVVRFREETRRVSPSPERRLLRTASPVYPEQLDDLLPLNENYEQLNSLIREEDRVKHIRFSNPGTDCFLNALLQAMISAPTFLECLNRAERALVQRGDTFSEVALELRRLLSSTGDQSVSHLRTLLPRLMRLPGDFTTGQQDASEVLSLLLEHLKPLLGNAFTVKTTSRRGCTGRRCPMVRRENWYLRSTFSIADYYGRSR